jgi:hypothetical protein
MQCYAALSSLVSVFPVRSYHEAFKSRKSTGTGVGKVGMSSLVLKALF